MRFFEAVFFTPTRLVYFFTRYVASCYISFLSFFFFSFFVRAARMFRFSLLEGKNRASISFYHVHLRLATDR